MAADHRRKRLNGATIAGCSLLEQQRNKKKKYESHKYNGTAKPHISLEWDGNQKKVVAKRAQIGISRKASRPFSDSITQGHSRLADAFDVPQEIFKLENLKEVLSYEVWRTLLSENDRNYVMQFLPDELDSEEVVRTLLSVDNFHFGNPFLKWSTSLSSGNLHPDTIIHQEKCLASDKKAFHLNVQKYHEGMIKVCQMWKEPWENSKNPVEEVLPYILRSRRDEGKRNPPCVNEPGFLYSEENVMGTSDSQSLPVEEKASSSDNQNSSQMKCKEPQKRINDKSFAKEKFQNQVVISDESKPGKGDNLEKHNIHLIDGDKYMSYLKITKKQLQLVKNMKQSGKSIQSKSLNKLLGNLDTLHVQPFQEFLKEEEKKLQEHWLQLANKDLPAAHAHWIWRQLRRKELTKALEQEMKEKIAYSEVEEKEKLETVVEHQNDQEASNDDSYMESDLKDLNDQGAGKYETDVEGVHQDQCGSQASEHEISMESLPEEHDDEEVSEPDVDSGSELEDQNDKGSSIEEKNEETVLPYQNVKEAILHESKVETTHADQYGEGDADHESDMEDFQDRENENDEFNHHSGPGTTDGEVGYEQSGLISLQNASPRWISSFTAEHSPNPIHMDLQKCDSKQLHSQRQISPPAGSDAFNPVDSDLENASSPRNQPHRQICSVSGGHNLQSVGMELENAGLPRHQPPGQISLVSFGHGLDTTDMGLDSNRMVSESEDPSPDVSKYLENANVAETTISQAAPIPPYRDVWSAVSIPRFDSTANHEYTSTSEFSLPLQAIDQQRTPLINLEPSMHEKAAGQHLLHRQPGEGSFNSFTNHDRTGLSQSVFKNPGLSPYFAEQKQVGFDFSSASNILMEDGQLTQDLQGQFQPSLSFEQGPKRLNNDTVHQSITGNIYSTVGGYSVPRRGNLPTNNVQDWAINPVSASGQLQSHLNEDGLLPQSWYHGEAQVGGWTGAGAANILSQSIGINTADQSLYSVLPQGNQLRPTEQFMPRSYNVMSGSAPRIINNPLEPALPLDYSSGRTTAANHQMMPEDMAWVNLPPQNSSLHDPIGRPYMRSWNQ